MEGVGARFGRSSTRYGPATVFSGPVRKWKKRWIHVSPSSSSSATTSNHNNSSGGGIVINNSGTTSNGNNGSHLLLYKWTPLTHSNHKDAAASSNSNSISNSNSNNNNNNHKAAGNANAHANPDETDARHQQPPRRKFKYIPVYLIEQQKREAEENEEVDDEAKLSDNDPKAAGLIPKNDGLDEKPDINDVPMEENQDDNQVVQQDLNESTLDLSLGLKSHDGDSDSMADQSRDGQ